MDKSYVVRSLQYSRVSVVDLAHFFEDISYTIEHIEEIFSKAIARRNQFGYQLLHEILRDMGLINDQKTLIDSISPIGWTKDSDMTMSVKPSYNSNDSISDTFELIITFHNLIEDIRSVL